MMIKHGIIDGQGIITTFTNEKVRNVLWKLRGRQGVPVKVQIEKEVIPCAQ